MHANTSVIEDYLESSAFPTRVMYACPNISTTHRIVPLNLGTPTYMRAPGVATGTYALEVAMDELAYELKMDPLQLRLLELRRGRSAQQEALHRKKPSRMLQREPPRHLAGRAAIPSHARCEMAPQLIGWGMATETYPANRNAAGAYVRLLPDGRVLVGFRHRGYRHRYVHDHDPGGRR